MLTAVQVENTVSSAAHHASRLLAAILVVIAFTAISQAQTIVPGNPGGGARWVRTGIRVENGTLITVTARGTVNVGPRGSFGPEGTTAFPGDRTLAFPSDVGPLYGLVIRLTDSETNPEDEIREDYAYGGNRTICSHSKGWLWLTVNDDVPWDNSGEFVVSILLGACVPVTPNVRATRIHVSSEANMDQPGAEVYFNERMIGVTGSDGMLVLPELPAGSRLMARVQIFENPTYRANHSRGSTRDWNFRVYQTSRSVNDDGSLNSFIISEPTATQELRVTRANTLIGLHLLASVEWDASSAELTRLRDEQLVPMSQFLYNATDGQFFVEQFDLVDDAAFWADTDYRIFADLEVRPNVNRRPGGFLQSAGRDTWINMRRDPGTTDTWTLPSVYAHEFGHYGFDLRDEYQDERDDIFCTSNILVPGGEYGAGAAKASCMMYDQFNGPKLCSDRPENLHMNGTRQGEENCWKHLADQYSDTRSGTSLNSWLISTPGLRRAIVGTLPNLPSNWQPRVNIENRSRPTLCEPFTVVVIDRATRAPMDNVEVQLRTSYGQNIVQGKTGGYETGSGPASFGSGMLPITGIHVGDRIAASGGEYLVTSADCSATSMLGPGRMKFLTVSDRKGTLFSHPVNTHRLNAAEQAQERSVQVSFSAEPFTLSASVEPTTKAGEVRIRVRSTSPLSTPPELKISLSGSTGEQSVGMSFDQVTRSYTGMATLPINSKANLDIKATNTNGQTVSRFFSLALSPLNPDTESDLFSSNGQLSVTIPNGALSDDAIVAIGPSNAPPIAMDPGMVVVSGPFSVAASQRNSLSHAGVVRFQLPNRLGARAVDGFDRNSFEIWRYNEAKNNWERVGGTLLEKVDVISLTTDQLGDYAVVARLSSSPSPSKAGEAFAVIDASLKAEKAEVVGQCPATINFTGYITTNKPGTVKYTFTRGDGATGPVFAIDFDAAGTKSVSTTWTLGGPGLMEYQGWQHLKILSPNEMESDLERGSFKLPCSK